MEEGAAAGGGDCREVDCGGYRIEASLLRVVRGGSAFFVSASARSPWVWCGCGYDTVGANG